MTSPSDKCARCAARVTGKPHWDEVKGWDKHRKQGGTNAISLRKRTGRVMCDPCMTLLKAGVPANQGRFF